MAHQIFLLSLSVSAQDDDTVREELAEAIHRVGGFILMAAGAGALIAAFDEQWQPWFRQHEAIEVCGALNLDPNGAAADKLRHLFAANVAAQLSSRTAAQASTDSASPRHRPLVWHRPATRHPLDDSGVRISTHSHSRGTP
jgi:hypothetical protein